MDLTQAPEDLLAKMHRTTRYNIRVSVRKGVSIHEGQENDLTSFYDMLTQTAERNNFPVRPFDYYQQEWLKYHPKGRAKLFIAKYQGKPIGARMAFFVGKYAADLHAASLMEFNHLKANALLVWEPMLWAKENGCIVYDLWGIPDEVGDASCKGESEPAQGEGGLWGVYQFKSGFGGGVVYYVGAYDYRYIKLLYSFFVTGLFRNASIEEVLHRFFNR